MVEREPIRQAKEQSKAEILSKPNVVGVGVGFKEKDGKLTDEVVVVALVRDKVPKAGLKPRELVPQRVDGIQTDVIQVGEIRAQQSRTDRWRPAPGGVSLGHYQVTAGTFGAVVLDRTTGDRLILSNNHVLANSNDAAFGDPILQPGAIDGGQVSTDTIAHLERFCPIEYSTQPGTCGTADTYALIGNAVARLLDAMILDEILEIGEVAGTLPAGLGMAVRKSGRTTGLTTGTITVLDATVDVSYGSGRTARFENQIVTSAMSQGGDSGSLLVAGSSQQAVGLLFAGSEQTTIHSPIQAVLDCLNVTI
jgi:hypothetical protein